MIETLKNITCGTWIIIILISTVVLLNIVYVYQDVIEKKQIHYGKMTIILYGILIIFNQIEIDRQRSTIKRLYLNLFDEKVLRLECLKEINRILQKQKND